MLDNSHVCFYRMCTIVVLGLVCASCGGRVIRLLNDGGTGYVASIESCGRADTTIRNVEYLFYLDPKDLAPIDASRRTPNVRNRVASVLLSSQAWEVSLVPPGGFMEETPCTDNEGGNLPDSIRQTKDFRLFMRAQVLMVADRLASTPAEQFIVECDEYCYRVRIWSGDVRGWKCLFMDKRSRTGTRSDSLLYVSQVLSLDSLDVQSVVQWKKLLEEALGCHVQE